MEGPRIDDADAPQGAVEEMRAGLWVPVAIASFGIAAVILLSLWVSGWRVHQAMIVQVEGAWRPQEALALRVLHIDGGRQPIAGSRVRATVEQGGALLPLGDFADPAEIGAMQGRFEVPALALGAAALHLEIESADLPPLREAIAVEVVDARPPRQGDLTISTSNLNWGDNTEPQPEGLRIVVRPERRLLAGFDNTLMIRVTDPAGAPHRGDVEVALVGGEFMGIRGSVSAPPILAHATCDRLGLVMVKGPLTSEILEIEVRVVDPGVVLTDDARIRGRRRFRMVSFAGAVRLESDRSALQPGETLELAGYGLRRARPIFVDLHGPDGAWIDTFDPPLSGREPPRPWSTAALEAGFVQAEGYYFTNDPGESAEILRIQVTQASPGDAASLGPVIERYRELLELPRVERAFDKTCESCYLAQVELARLTPEEVEAARRWLLGTLPVQVIGPPLAASTLDRVSGELVARKLAWYSGLRIALLGGGTLFLLVLAWLILRRHGQIARATAEALRGSEAESEIAAQIAGAQRGAILRMWALVVVMGLGLVLVAVALERIIWRV